MKRSLKIVLIIVAVIAILVILFFINRKQDKLVCKKIDIEVSYLNNDTFLTAPIVNTYLTKKFPSIKGKVVEEIDISGIEKYLSKNPYVQNANVYTSFVGNLVVKITQRQPVVRIIDANNKQFYMDRQCIRMPLSDQAVSYVPIASGYIPSVNKDTLNQIMVYNDILKIVNYINTDDFFKNQIDQIYINSNKEIELVPKIGRQVIIFGDTSEMEEKFSKLKIFYQQGIPKTGWNAYKSINLKYKNQVVCSK